MYLRILWGSGELRAILGVFFFLKTENSLPELPSVAFVCHSGDGVTDSSLKRKRVLSYYKRNGTQNFSFNQQDRLTASCLSTSLYLSHLKKQQLASLDNTRIDIARIILRNK